MLGIYLSHISLKSNEMNEAIDNHWNGRHAHGS